MHAKGYGTFCWFLSDWTQSVKRSYQGHEALTFCKFLAVYLLTALSLERIPQLVKRRIQQVKGRRPCPFDPLLRNKGSWVGWSAFDWPWGPLGSLDSHVRRAPIRPAHWGSKLSKNGKVLLRSDDNRQKSRIWPTPSFTLCAKKLIRVLDATRRMRHAKGEKEKKKKWSTSVLKVSRFITTEQWTLQKTSLALFWMSCNAAWPPKERKLTRHKQRLDWLLIQRQHGASASFFFFRFLFEVS